MAGGELPMTRSVLLSNADLAQSSAKPVSGPLPCCGQLASVNECKGDFSTIIVATLGRAVRK
jgi:hypothetical protein